MSTPTPPLPPAVDALLGDLKKNWGWLLALGIAFVVLGTVGIGAAAAFTVATVMLFGVLLLLGAASQVAQALRAKGWKASMPHLLIAVLYLVGGMIMVLDPVGASGALTLLIAGVLIAAGIMRIISSLQMRGSPGWGFLLAGGVASVVLGFLVVSGWPASGLWFIGLMVALELIFSGWAYIFIALAIRRAAQGG
jgi:uncharacterized membrane protein HdeD (DUF308 family)